MDYFKKKKNDFSVLKFTLVILLVAFVGSTAIREIRHYKTIQQLSNHMYAINPESGVVIGLQKIPYTSVERKAEYIAHIRDFLKHFYQFDQYTFLQNMDYASNLMSTEIFDIEIQKYRTENTLGRLEERDIIASVVIDNIKIDFNTKQGSFFLLQTLRIENNLKERAIEGNFKIADTEGRSVKNPHACLISNYTIQRKEVTRE